MIEDLGGAAVIGDRDRAAGAAGIGEGSGASTDGTGADLEGFEALEAGVVVDGDPQQQRGAAGGKADAGGGGHPAGPVEHLQGAAGVAADAGCAAEQRWCEAEVVADRRIQANGNHGIERRLTDRDRTHRYGDRCGGEVEGGGIADAGIEIAGAIADGAGCHLEVVAAAPHQIREGIDGDGTAAERQRAAGGADARGRIETLHQAAVGSIEADQAAAGGDGFTEVENKVVADSRIGGAIGGGAAQQGGSSRVSGDDVVGGSG